MLNQIGGNNMKKTIIPSYSRVVIVAILFLFSWCIEPYEFRVINNTPTLVVEGHISDVSFDETLDYPSEGRYFEVNLRRTSDVVNIYDKVESNATVMLISDKGEFWQYEEIGIGSGRYLLLNNTFKAESDLKYKLQITLSNGDFVESGWEGLPKIKEDKMGDISFIEKTEQGYIVEAGEEKIRDIQGIEVQIDLPTNITSSPIHYMWNFDPMWVYISPFTSSSQEIHKCWITNDQYLSNYVLNQDYVGDYPQDLVFFETKGNDRIYKKFSLLITQFTLTKDYYNYWKELKEQSKNGGLFDAPPYNLQSNFTTKTTNEKITGYFGVVHEQAKRWYFNKDDLSYNVIDRTLELCSISYGPDGPGGPECYNCMEYPYGDPSNTKPEWWSD